MPYSKHVTVAMCASWSCSGSPRSCLVSLRWQVRVGYILTDVGAVLSLKQAFIVIPLIRCRWLVIKCRGCRGCHECCACPGCRFLINQAVSSPRLAQLSALWLQCCHSRTSGSALGSTHMHTRVITRFRAISTVAWSTEPLPFTNPSYPRSPSTFTKHDAISPVRAMRMLTMQATAKRARSLVLPPSPPRISLSAW